LNFDISAYLGFRVLIEIRNENKEEKILKIRIILTSCVAFMGFFLLGTKVTYLQVYKSDFLKTKFDKQFIRIEQIEPKRGFIYDRNHNVLALSILTDSYFCMPREVEDKFNTANVLANDLKIDKNKFLNTLSNKKSFFWIIRKVPIEMSQKLKDTKFPKGIGRIKEAKRFYPKGSFCSQVLGVTGLDNRGLCGIEYKLNDYLKGKNITMSVGKDALGREIVSNRTLNIEDTADDVALTIDEMIQYSVEKNALELYNNTKSKSVTVVVEKIDTGEILAMANLPSFDGNDIVKPDLKLLKNNAVSYVYEPGSTFKVFIMAAALQENRLNLDTKFFCENGSYQLADVVINDHEKKGWLTAKEIIAYSSNIGMAKIGQNLGKDKLYSYIQAFGFGTYTGIELPGEAKGIIRHPSKWSLVSEGIVSFGQEVGVTPIQLVNAYACLANGGVLLEPRVIKSVTNGDGKEIFKFQKSEVRRVISKKTCSTIIEAMEEVVKSGTAVKVQIPGYRIAGKTGTAQKINPATRKYYADKYIASFAGFFPVSKPQIAILVIADEPQGIYWGGEICGPIFRNIAKDIICYLNIPPDGN
jgi:cell division protein FtsI (penicillin-binding protein 3)